MSWGFTADVLKYAEAVRALRKRVAMSDDEWNALTERARQKAFKVAGIAQLDLVTEVADAIAKALDDGSTFDEFRAALREKLTAAWAGTVDNPAHRISTIFRTNLQTSYSHARVRQMRDPAVAKVRPFFLFDGTSDSRQTQLCHGLTGTVLPQDDPFWATRTPPLHFSCRSGLRSLRRSQAEALGITAKRPNVDADDGFGVAPSDDGDDAWEPDLEDYPDDLVAEYVDKLTANG